MTPPNDPQDPFAAFNSDRTVIKPSAGRGTAAPAAAAPSAGPSASAPPLSGAASGGRDAPLSLDAPMGGSLNPLVDAAVPLLVAAPKLRQTARHPNPAGLREALAEGIRKFEAKARQLGLPNEQVVAGRYMLCTLLDEAAASTPWGGSGAWSAHSLLVQFHNETWGGEKVFALLSKLAENVEGNRNLLELMYVALAFGFEGRYRVLENGRAQLDGVRQRLAQILQQGKVVERTLSPRWAGHASKGQQLGEGLPLWAVALGLVLVLALVYAGFRLALGIKSDPVFTQLAALDAKVVKVSQPPPPAAKPRLAGLLKPEIDAGKVEVRDLADRSVVIIKGEGFFEPGSIEIASSARELVPKIAQELAKLQGQVLITGHTDNQPIRTLRFPSNWHLSQERADVVKAQLARQVAPSRLRAEGRGDAEPVDDNSTPAGRSRNRRVEITLFVQSNA